MVSITVKGIITEDRQLETALPDNLPADADEVTITALLISPGLAPSVVRPG